MREFIIDRDDGVQERRRFQVERGKVIYFVIQLEVKIEDVWRPVIRWDNSHSVADCDRYNLKGQKDKYKLYGMSAADVFAHAQSSLNSSWQHYVDEFLRGDFPQWHPPYTSTG